MLKKLLLYLVLLVFTSHAFAQDIKSPESFLGYKLGNQFTPHHRIIEYFGYISQASKNVKLIQYGSTNEGRPLFAMFIASDKNINKLEEIRLNNLRLAGLEQGAATINAATPVIVWFSYNVHGNEPSSSEAAMQTLYDLVNPANQRTIAWLKNTVVVIDPCLNPDGRERYVSFYNSVKGLSPDAHPSSSEHAEPWPGGRTNHYYFDLNRDWAWQTQKETQARLALFSKWLPQIHVDYHEQGYNAPYYFAPAVEPIHKVITKWQREFQIITGKNNAKYFDQNGWLYFTKQEFDLLYPSYGDTYPIYNGSIGMTYEQGGIGAGLAVVTATGDTLTLADRIAHHHSTGLSTIETASAYSKRLLDEFKIFYDNSRENPPGLYKSYIIENTNNDKIVTLSKMLERNGIQFSFGLKSKVTGYNYISGKTEQYEVKATDMVINAHQPKSVLLNVLMEPKTIITDSNTYDITAWSLPYAYGLPAYALKESIKPNTTQKTNILPSPAAPIAPHAYAYVSAWQSVSDVKFLAALLKMNIKVRYSEKPFEAGGKKFTAGSLLITRAGNDRVDFDQAVTGAAKELNHELTSLATGFVEKGSDIGSDVIRYIRMPKVMLVAGDEVSAEEMGEVWHFFEQQIGYPITIVRYRDIQKARLSDFNTIIFPNGKYQDLPSDKLQNWVREGGKLIALQNAVAQLADKKDFSIKKKEKKEDTLGKSKATAVHVYKERNTDAIRSSVPGAIYKLNLDTTHPLGFGLSSAYYLIKLSDDIYEYMGDDGWNVGTVKKDGYVSGFVGQKSKEKIKDGLLLGVQNLGRGTVVYMVDDPLFRSFWENGKLLFSNAVFMVGQ